MKTILICHKGDLLTEHGFARWLSSFSDLVGIVKIQEDGSRLKQRVRAEVKRSGFLRFIFDILSYRLFSKIAHSKKDERWVKEKIKDLSRTYPDLPDAVKFLVTNSPNSPQAIEFVSSLAPDMMLARCKTMIREELYSIPVE